jgi:hypothetical protein
VLQSGARPQLRHFQQSRLGTIKRHPPFELLENFESFQCRDGVLCGASYCAGEAVCGWPAAGALPAAPSNPQVAILFGVAIVRLLAQQPESFTRSAVQPIHAEGDHLSFANRGIRV